MALLRSAALIAATLVLLAAAGARAQTRLDSVEELDFDRPEAWGMQFAAAVTAFSALEAPRPLGAGEIDLALEAASVPSLSEEERRIGFVGTKVEDIDRSPAFGRLRAAFGLGHRFELELGVVPPIELDGLTPTFFAVALARPLVERRALRLAARLGAQTGTLEGDITCSRADVAAGSDPIGNPFGCEAPSNDELETTLASLELIAAHPPREPGGFEPFFALGLHRLDGRFQVDARYRGVIDRTRLETDGGFWSAALGAGGTIAAGWRLAGALLYSPLEIRRPGEGVTVEPVFNVRLGLARRLH